MKEQEFENHSRMVPMFHYVTLPIIFVLFIGSIVNLVQSKTGDYLSASLICGTSFVLILVAFYARSFALKAQDRAIRAEENLRHFVLTGSLLPPEVTMSQVIALRFASDADFLVLSRRAVTEKLTNTEIKELIKRWRADNHRV